MPATFTDRFARRLDAQTSYDVSEATENDCVRSGEVLVAQGGYHLTVETTRPERIDVSLTETPPRHGVRPSIDVTMETAAAVDSTPLVGIALTGMGSDGVDGLAEIKAAGGTTIAQDEATSPVFGIPRRAIEAGVVDQVLPAGEIVPALVDAIATTGDTHA
jgi:two-component system chemotaxis response regulator CheB